MKERLLTPDTKVAIILWRDAFLYKNEELSEDDLAEVESQAVMVRSAGIVLSDNEDNIMLALTQNTVPVVKDEPEIDYECVLCIPQKYIIKKKYLK